MKSSLRNRIFWWSTASTLVILIITFLFVDRAFRENILRGQQASLVSDTRLLAELQQSELNQGLDRAVGLAATPTLRAAVETGDSLTIQQNLQGLLDPALFDGLLLLSPDGRLMNQAGIDVRAGLRRESAASLIRDASFYDTADIWAMEERIVEVYATTLGEGPEPTAILLGVQDLGEDRIERLEASTERSVALVSEDGIISGADELGLAERADLVGAWIARASDANLGVAAVVGGDPVRQFRLTGRRFIGTTIPLLNAQSEPVARLIAYNSLDEALAPARELQLALVLIAAFGLLLALAGSYLFASRIIKPVNQLLEATVRLGSGDLDQPVKQAGDDEIGRLARGFETMRQSLRDARAELLRAERLSAVGQAASAIVHDFRQPVTVIQGHLALLKTDVDDPVERAEDIATIEEQVERLTLMMSEVLDFARGADSMNPTMGSVRELLEEVTTSVRPMLRQREIALDVDSAYEGEWRLDYPRTQRVLENLLRNAAAAVGPGGSVALRSKCEEGVLRIMVEDSGPGIPAEIRDRLFEPFATFGKREGTGLGLAIVKNFTEKQGGRVKVETSSSGTRFMLDFPNGVAA